MENSYTFLVDRFRFCGYPVPRRSGQHKMSPAAAAQKIYNVTVNLQIKRGKEEIDFARSETDKLHNLIATDKEIDWAKTRIVALHEMIFLPPTEVIKTDLVAKLKEVDPER